MKRGGLLLAMLVACGGARDATPALDVNPAPAPSPCTTASTIREAASALVDDARFGRARRKLAEAEELCPGRSADADALRARIASLLAVAPDVTSDALVAAAASETAAPAARRLYARAAVALERETGAKPLVALENALAGVDPYDDMAWAGDASAFAIAQDFSLIVLDPKTWRERSAVRFDARVHYVESIPRSPAFVVVTEQQTAVAHLIDGIRDRKAAMTRPSTSIRPVASPDGTRVLVAEEDRRSVRLVSVADGSVLATLAPEDASDSLQPYTAPYRWSPSGKLAVVEWANGRLRVYDGTTGSVQLSEPLSAATESRGRRWRLSDDERWLTWIGVDPKTRRSQWFARDRTGTATTRLAADGCKDGDVLAIAHRTGRAAVYARTWDVARLCVIDLATGRTLGSVDIPDLKRDKRGKLEDPPWANGVAFTADDAAIAIRTGTTKLGERIRFARTDGVAWLSTPPNGVDAARLVDEAVRPVSHDDEPSVNARRRHGPLPSPDGRFVVTRTDRLRVNDAAGKLIFTSEPAAEQIAAVRFVEQDDRRPAAIAIANIAGGVRRVDLGSGAVTNALAATSAEGYRNFALDGLGAPVVAASHTDLEGIEWKTTHRLYTPAAPDGRIVPLWSNVRLDVVKTRAAADARGTLFALSDGEDVHVVEIATGVERAVIKAPDTVLALALSADGSRIATATKDSPLQLWDVGGGAICSVPDVKDGGENYRSLAFAAANGALVVTHTYRDTQVVSSDGCATKAQWSPPDVADPHGLSVSRNGERIAIRVGPKIVVLDGALHPLREVPFGRWDVELSAVAGDGSVAVARDDSTVDVYRGSDGALSLSLLVPARKEATAAVVAPDGRYHTLGDPSAARAYLSCRFGMRSVPLDVCESTLEDPTLLSP